MTPSAAIEIDQSSGLDDDAVHWVETPRLCPATRRRASVEPLNIEREVIRPCRRRPVADRRHDHRESVQPPFVDETLSCRHPS